ncbi:Transcriptional regulator, ArsR family [Kocuria palustris PEL]|uniref:Transcriptional regulator, ArsR family n=1 Tax=Kocuria palustris PEL TaxID=1236550 RepID=M2XWS4_9MICC|nr:metalloregulator ArsR/SmtB family transcription factor [Kocuria palustris]EME37268.1 Transcriptional regulator, ArsR family [Kocuria palustris PEL]
MTQDVFTALADPTRRALLEELSIGERAVGELVAAVEASQPTVSKHLRVLRESGLVHQRAVGQKRFYRIEAEPLLETAEALRELVGRQHREAASSASPVETAEPLEPAQSTEPVRIVSQEAPEPQEDAQPAASADEAVVGEAVLAAAPAASAAQEAAPQRLDPLSAVQDGQSPARGRGVSGLVSSVLRRRRR